MSRRLVRAVAKLLVATVVVLLAATSVLFVDETECVIVERLGHIVAVYDRPADRGLHFKLPWPVGTARRFDSRVQLFDPPGREIFTRDKKNITVDAYVCWKIADAPNESASPLDRPVVRFFRSLGTFDIAEARLDSRVRSILSTEIGQVELSSLLGIDDSEQGPQADNSGVLESISQTVADEVSQRPKETESLRERLGIDIVDVRIKRINFPAGNQQAVFERMKSERRKIADSYRSAGLAENTVIKSQADRQYSELISKADADAERIRGEAEADALTILNKAHAADPEFYQFIRTLDTYRKILNERTTLVLSASSNLLKLLTEGVPPAGVSRETPAPLASPTSPPTAGDGQKPGEEDAESGKRKAEVDSAGRSPAVTQSRTNPPAKQEAAP